MVTQITKTNELSIRQQAALAVNKELAEVALGKMKRLLKDKAAAESVVKGIELQIIDLERQIEDGTL